MLLPGRRHFDATKVGSGLDGLSVPPPLKAEGQTGIERLQPFLTRGIRFPEPNAAAFKGVPHHNSPCRFPTTSAIADRKKPPGVLQETLVDEQTNPPPAWRRNHAPGEPTSVNCGREKHWRITEPAGAEHR